MYVPYLGTRIVRSHVARRRHVNPVKLSGRGSTVVVSIHSVRGLVRGGSPPGTDCTTRAHWAQPRCVYRLLCDTRFIPSFSTALVSACGAGNSYEYS